MLINLLIEACLVFLQCPYQCLPKKYGQEKGTGQYGKRICTIGKTGLLSDDWEDVKYSKISPLFHRAVFIRLFPLLSGNFIRPKVHPNGQLTELFCLQISYILLFSQCIPSRSSGLGNIISVTSLVQQPKYLFSIHLSWKSSTILHTTTFTFGNTFKSRFTPIFPAK